MTRRYSTSRTHLFPGALLTALDGAPVPILHREPVLIEFSDGIGVGGTIEPYGEKAYLLTVSGHRTQRQTPIGEKAWSIAATPDPTVFRVGAKVDLGPSG